MFAILKILHFLALLLGGAGTIAPGILRRALVRSGHDGPPPAYIGAALRIFGILGLVAIVLLWITGGAMMSIAHSWGDMTAWFWVKLLAATVILAISAFLNLRAARAARGGAPASPALVKTGLSIVRAALLIAIICAVLAFA